MKGNNGSGNTVERDEWQTPKELWNKLCLQYKFRYDCCATHKNSKCIMYSSNFDEWYNYSINLTAWMNPPFSKALIMFKCFFKKIKKGVAIYRCDNMETKVWQEVILPNCSWVFIPNKRIKYEGMEGNGSRFPSALIGFHVDKPLNLQGKLLTVHPSWKNKTLRSKDGRL